jgi:hypothetical protein
MTSRVVHTCVKETLTDMNTHHGRDPPSVCSRYASLWPRDACWLTSPQNGASTSTCYTQFCSGVKLRWIGIGGVKYCVLTCSPLSISLLLCNLSLQEESRGCGSLPSISRIRPMRGSREGRPDERCVTFDYENIAKQVICHTMKCSTRVIPEKNQFFRG